MRFKRSAESFILQVRYAKKLRYFLKTPPVKAKVYYSCAENIYIQTSCVKKKRHGK